MNDPEGDEATMRDEAFQEIIRVLEGAVQAGVDCVGLEYQGADLLVFYRRGQMGCGTGSIPERLQQAVVEEIVKRAGLNRRSRGRMSVALHGNEREVIVEEYNSFGESAFTLTLEKAKSTKQRASRTRRTRCRMHRRPTMPDDEYPKHEQVCERIKKDNAKLLVQFNQWLSGKGLTEKTARRHVENADFYINTFLLYEDAIPAKEGASRISMFLGYWFIRKAMWASPSAIRENAASLKKFYTFMQQQDEVPVEALQDLKETIKEEIPEWLGTLKRYDDPDIIDPEEVWGL